MDLSGRTALVTGGGRGLGRSVALALATHGARVAVISHDTPELVGLRAELHAMGQPTWVAAADVSDRSAVQSAVDEVERHLGAPEILVNNAAVIGPPRFFEDADQEAWRRTVEVNLNGPYHCVRAVLPHLLRNGRGSVVNLSSGLGEMPFPRFCAYAITKAAIIQFTRSLAEEFKHRRIRVNAVDPGVMDTPMQAEIRALEPAVLGEEVYREFAAYQKNNALKDPADVARLIVWLCSSQAKEVTGINGTLAQYARLGWPQAAG